MFSWVYAKSAWAQTKSLISILSESRSKETSANHTALTNAITTAYSRPFATSYYGKPLTSEVIPKSYEVLHDDLVRIRDKGAAHSDGTPFGSAQHEPIRNAVCMRVHMLKPGLRAWDYSSRRFTVTDTSIKRLPALLEILMKKSDYHVQKIRDKYLSSRPRELGHYVLNVENDTEPMWIPDLSQQDALVDDDLQ
jgi:hypothetical protein